MYISRRQPGVIAVLCFVTGYESLFFCIGTMTGNAMSFLCIRCIHERRFSQPWRKFFLQVFLFRQIYDVDVNFLF